MNAPPRAELCRCCVVDAVLRRPVPLGGVEQVQEAQAVQRQPGVEVVDFRAQGSQNAAVTAGGDDLRFPAPGNWRDTCSEAEPAATPVPVP